MPEGDDAHVRDLGVLGRGAARQADVRTHQPVDVADELRAAFAGNGVTDRLVMPNRGDSVSVT